MPKYIDELTEEQRAAMAPYAQRWIDECLRSGTTEEDWQRAERGIRASYRAAGLEEPRVIIRTTSPLACVFAGPIAAHLLGGVSVDGAVRDAVHGAVSGAVRDAVHGAVSGAVSNAVHGAVSGAVSNAVHGTVSGAVSNAVGGAVSGAVDDAVDGAVADSVDVVSNSWTRYNGGSLWPGWCAWRLFFIDMCALDVDPHIAKLCDTWEDLSTGAGWWWPHKQFCIVAPRHDHISRDERGRLHSATGPALLYPDGWAIWSWHGVRVPREWIEDPENIDPTTALNHPNVEQRRCAAEILGWDRVLAKLPTRTIDRDRDPMVGELLEVDLPDSPRQQFLRVLCGTGRTFVLPCVHNRMKTALEANAASWGENGIDPSLVRDRQGRT